MNRRRHKKSRLGCQECKRRHIKCDEKQPTCSHCAITHRDCHYVSSSAAAETPGATTATATATPESTHHSDEAHSPIFAATVRAGASSTVEPRIISRPYLTCWTGEPLTAGLSPFPNGTVNMNHMEFLMHYKFSIAIPELADEFDTAATTVMTRMSLQFPWLLHAMLAISSRHLAVIKPEKAGLYLSEAFQLQNQAISIFNSERLHINETNCSPALLFSSIIGRHMLVDTLAGVEADGSVVLDSYCHYVQIHRGLRAISTDSWQFLPESEMWPFMVFGGIHKPRKGRGPELEGLRRWLHESQGLDDEGLEICLKGVDLLQAGLDEIIAAKTPNRRYQMAFIWSVCNNDRFNEFVMQRIPQALVVLAHYAALLHHARGIWQINDAGYRFLHAICSMLGPSYEDQLRWVRDLVFGPRPGPVG
ncbi:putative Zn 2Cys6 transcription factor [Rosellinia necatrix]|uniref:Putative Zn 2Cys6 transcription factor n=1 Tax=Rosellinia necatrix TaxID=77044 RepID=A0A1W2TJ91_ROSNE|nr:putative Zn 2Cys6 transcription factor [Rosellinia necatrix]